jgi:2-keto-4-pentenoate hydratase/2-oxohepta-3-ene-1,7-dioic acid hydratase in catechol pathway
LLSEADPGFRDRFPDLRALLAAGALGSLAEHCGAEPLHPESVHFLPVIPNPDKVICVGVNYRPHVEEMGRELPDKPVVFVRFAGSQVGHGQAVIRPAASEQFDFEGELAVVIGRRARHVGCDEALDFVAGYCCFMDGSVRDWQRHSGQFTAGKNFHRSGSMGPQLVTADEISDVRRLRLETRVNGAVMQTGSIDELIFDIPCLIEYCSAFCELLPGDVIATGTPGGVGAARKPPVWLRAGDRVTVDIEGIGRLENEVADE